MEHSTIIALVALGLTIASSLATLGEKLFGGGNKLASKFASLERNTTTEINSLRMEFVTSRETSDANSRVGMDAITANIHRMELGLLEFRAKMAEDYMRRDSYYKASEELKRDFKEKHDDLKHEMHQGFADLKDQVGAVAQSIEAGRKQTRHT